jgi:hypothetical protein
MVGTSDISKRYREKNLPPKKNLKSSNPKGSLLRAGGRGGLGGIPPALQILGEISSNFFESTPQRQYKNGH